MNFIHKFIRSFLCMQMQLALSTLQAKCAFLSLFGTWLIPDFAVELKIVVKESLW